MVGYGDRLPRGTRRGALVTVAVVSLVTAVLFQTSVLAYLSVYEASNTEVAVTSAGLSEDGTAIVARLDVTSRSSRPVSVTGAKVFARVDGVLVNNVANTSVGETRLEPGETASVRIRLTVLDGRADALSTWASGEATLRLSGELRIEVRSRTVGVRFEEDA